MRSRHNTQQFAFAIWAILLSLLPLAHAESTRSTAKRSLGISRDLEGMWTARWLTPIERPSELKDKAYFAAGELAEQQKQSSERFWQAGHRSGEVGRDNDEFLDDGLKLLPNGQTSLIIDPPDGKVPLLSSTEAIRDFNLKNFDSYERMSQWDRCISRNPTAMIPVIYNNAYQIVQTPTQIVLVSEMIHDARVIPIDGRPHVHSNIRSWNGDSRAHWEGNTLVVETTNFNDRGWIATGGNSGRIRGVPYSTELRIIERFTRIDARTLNYQATIEDPRYYTTPWTLSFPLERDDQYRMFEYACHEGNDAVRAILQGARAQEQTPK